MAKSEGNFLKLKNLIEKGMDPLTYRFWLLMASYHTKMNFNWEALEGAENALKRLYRLYVDLGGKAGKISKEYQQKFKKHLEDDLDTPRALSTLWDLMKDEDVSDADKKATILDFDKVLGLGFVNIKEEKIPEEVARLAASRQAAREAKDFKLSDEIRAKINSLGYEVKDTPDGQKISKI